MNANESFELFATAFKKRFGYLPLGKDVMYRPSVEEVLHDLAVVYQENTKNKERIDFLNGLILNGSSPPIKENEGATELNEVFTAVQEANNCETWLENPVTMITDGTSYKAMWLSMTLWSSEEDEREWDEKEYKYEPLGAYLIKIQKRFLEEIKSEIEERGLGLRTTSGVTVQVPTEPSSQTLPSRPKDNLEGD